MLVARASLEKTCPSSIPAAILSLGTAKAGTSTTMRFLRRASKSTSTRRRRSPRRKPSIRRSFNKSWISFRPAESRLDPPMKRSSSWQKLRGIKRMRICATPLQTRFTPPGSLARTMTGSTPPARLLRTKGNASSGMRGLRPRATNSKAAVLAKSKEGAANDEQRQQQQLSREMQMQPILTRLAEITALMRANQLKREVAELQVKIEFQSLDCPALPPEAVPARPDRHEILSQHLRRWRQPTPRGRGCKESLCQDQRPPTNDGHDRFARK